MGNGTSWAGVFQAGQQVGELTVVLSRSMKVGKNTRIYVLCRCSCGNEEYIRAKLVKPTAIRCFPCYLTAHATKSLHRSEYISWMSMNGRCYNANDPSYDRYGGRGITVCDQWRRSFATFLKDMGNRPKGTSLDRIDVNGNYEPGNCKWSTAKEQARNRRYNRMITCDGVTKTVAEWCDLNGLNWSAVSNRMRRGWTDQDAVTIPLKHNGRQV